MTLTSMRRPERTCERRIIRGRRENGDEGTPGKDSLFIRSKTQVGTWGGSRYSLKPIEIPSRADGALDRPDQIPNRSMHPMSESGNRPLIGPKLFTEGNQSWAEV